MKIVQNEKLVSPMKSDSFLNKGIYFTSQDSTPTIDLDIHTHNDEKFRSIDTVKEISKYSDFVPEISSIKIAPGLKQINPTLSDKRNQALTDAMFTNINVLGTKKTKRKQANIVKNANSVHTTTELLLKMKDYKSLSKNNKGTDITLENMNGKFTKQLQIPNIAEKSNFLEEKYFYRNAATNIDSFAESTYNVHQNYTSDVIFSLVSALILCICLISIIYCLFNNQKRKRRYWSSSKSGKLVDYMGPRRPSIMRRETTIQSYHFNSKVYEPRPPVILPSDVISEASHNQDVIFPQIRNSPSPPIPLDGKEYKLPPKIEFTFNTNAPICF